MPWVVDTKMRPRMDNYKRQYKHASRRTRLNTLSRERLCELINHCVPSLISEKTDDIIWQRAAASVRQRVSTPM